MADNKIDGATPAMLSLYQLLAEAGAGATADKVSSAALQKGLSPEAALGMWSELRKDGAVYGRKLSAADVQALLELPLQPREVEQAGNFARALEGAAAIVHS